VVRGRRRFFFLPWSPCARISRAQRRLLVRVPSSRNPRRCVGSVCAAAGAVGGGDLGGERRILALPFARSLLPPAVVAAGRYAQQLAEQAYAMLALHRLDLGIPLPGVSERMPSDFFSAVSRSRMRNSSARRSAISSRPARGCAETGALDPVRAASSLRHSYSAPTGMPSSSPLLYRPIAPQRQLHRMAFVCLVVLAPRRCPGSIVLSLVHEVLSAAPNRCPFASNAGRALPAASYGSCLGSAQPAYPACPLNRGNLKTAQCRSGPDRQLAQYARRPRPRPSRGRICFQG